MNKAFCPPYGGRPKGILQGNLGKMFGMSNVNDQYDKKIKKKWLTINGMWLSDQGEICDVINEMVCTIEH